MDITIVTFIEKAVSNDVFFHSRKDFVKFWCFIFRKNGSLGPSETKHSFMGMAALQSIILLKHIFCFNILLTSSSICR